MRNVRRRGTQQRRTILRVQVAEIFMVQQLITEGKSDRHFYQTHLREVFDSQEIELDLKEIEFKRKVAERINELDARAEQLDTQEEQLFQKLRLAEEQHDAKLTEAKENISIISANSLVSP